MCVCEGVCACVCVTCVVHACGSLLCHGEEGWRKTAVALNKNVFILRERGRLCLPKNCLSIFHHLKAPRRESERGAVERDGLLEL